MRAQDSTLIKPADIKEKWYIVDADGLVVGRLASRIAKVVRGKNLPEYAPHLDFKVHVIITNADKIVFTGNKLEDKDYIHHTRFRTGLKIESAQHLLERKPEEIIRRAIQGMLPKNRLGRTLNRHLRIYKSGEYTGQHDAQQPVKLEVKTRVPRAKA